MLTICDVRSLTHSHISSIFPVMAQGKRGLILHATGEKYKLASGEALANLISFVRGAN